MNIKLGTAPDSWGVWFADDPKQPTWQQFLDEVASLDYRYVEIGPYGYMPTDPNRLRAELQQRNMTPVANAIEGNLEEPAHWPALEKEANAAGMLLAALGAPYIILIDEFYSDGATGELKQPKQLDDAAWHRLIDTTHRVADQMKSRYGLSLTFHPHGETHVETEAQIERFLADTDPERVSLCLDTGHHAYAGGDAVSFYRKHHERMGLLHLKNVDGDKLREKNERKIPYGLAVPDDLFCEPSKGLVDFIALRDALREFNFDGYAIVEQDMYPAPLDKPLPIARRTRDYLKSIGF